jgi:hypothetical protein
MLRIHLNSQQLLLTNKFNSIIVSLNTVINIHASTVLPWRKASATDAKLDRKSDDNIIETNSYPALVHTIVRQFSAFLLPIHMPYVWDFVSFLRVFCWKLIHRYKRSTRRHQSTYFNSTCDIRDWLSMTRSRVPSCSCISLICKFRSISSRTVVTFGEHR